MSSLSQKRNNGRIWRQKSSYRSEYSTLNASFHRSIVKDPVSGNSQSPEHNRLLKLRSSIRYGESTSYFSESKFLSIIVGVFGRFAIAYEFNTTATIPLTLCNFTLIPWFNWIYSWLLSAGSKFGNYGSLWIHEKHNNICKKYESQALLCRFNNFWPKPMDLFH